MNDGLNRASITVYAPKGQVLSFAPVIPHPHDNTIEDFKLPPRIVKFKAHDTLEENLAEALAVLPALVLEDGTYRLVNLGQILDTVTIKRWTPDWDVGWDTVYEE